MAKPFDYSGLVVIPLVVNLASTLLVVLIAAGRRAFVTQLERRTPKYTWIPLAASSVLFIAGSVAVVVLVARERASLPLGITLLVTTATAFIVAVVGEARRYWRLGLRGADKSVSTGINYGESLYLARTDFEFLGTGGSKLTSLPNFQETMQRCSAAGGKIRFLLSKPDAQNLEAAARRAGRPADDYKRTVTQSLETLSAMRLSHGFDIEVRFYEGETAFRMVFLDERLCLCSYNVYGGKTPADEFPQLHAVRTPEGTKSFYWAFRRHFDIIWHQGSVWDFQEYLQS